MRASVRGIALAGCLAGITPAGLTALSASSLLVLQNPASVRAAGLGGAGAALLGDAASLFATPAGLALIRHRFRHSDHRVDQLVLNPFVFQP